MKKVYLSGAIVSAIIHAPLIKQKEYMAFAISTALWPLTAVLWLEYIRYVTWSTYKHEEMVKRKLGPYAETIST